MTDARQPNRLAKKGLIDQAKSLSFRFDGRDHAGYVGDTLASALLAADVKLVGRSFKYHRPRGILTAGSEEPNALVELRTGAHREPNTRATMAELYDGLEARSQNRWPSLGFDIGAVNSILSPIFVAGFYYKTFMWPAAAWERLYEPLIRRAAGLGRASMEPDPDTYEKAHAFCDVLVIGGGPAGIAAALAAGRTGARVILCDEDFWLGGRLNGERCEIDGMEGSAWARQAEVELASLSEVRLMRRTTVFGAYDGNAFGALERVSDHLRRPADHQPRQRLWKIVAKRTVLATGAIERPIVFGGNDRPGVMMASAARTYLNRFGVAPGRQITVFTAGDDGLKTATDLAAAGIAIQAIVDTRAEVSPTLAATANRIGAQTLVGAKVVDTRGAKGIDQISVCDRDGHIAHIPTDALAVAGGWNPNIGLSVHMGERPVWSDAVSAFVRGKLPSSMSAAGAAGGSFSLAAALREGIAAGAEAAGSQGFKAVPVPLPRADDEPTKLAPLWYVTESKSKAFVDFQNDVTYDDVALAAQEGFQSVEHLKRYTTLGMGTDQGKTSNVNGLAIMAALTDRTIPETGTTLSRPPISPVALGAFAGLHRGKHFKPTRLTAGHGWAAERGAVFVESGQWLRAQWFPLPGDRDWLDSISREVRSVRGSVGLCDVSTLGKIDIQGPDAGAFLDRIYINMFSTLAVGKTRYGLMLREDGIVMDDGTTARMTTDHFVMSTTTANAAKVMQHLEYVRQVLWPELDVRIASVTEQWAQYAVAGPNARNVLRNLLGGAIDLADTAFPYLACAEFFWNGLKVRLFRISFSGELAYELAVPARHGDSIVRAFFDAGAPYGMIPYGTEALGVMRIEKGHVAGNELNGTTTAGDLGLGRMMSEKKDFIGRILAQRPGLHDPSRPVLVGIRPIEPGVRLRAGAHFLSMDGQSSLEDDQGYLTSVAYSPTLGHWIGLGLLARGREREGERIRAHDPVRGPDIEVEVCPPIFVDPKGDRLRG